MKEAPGQRAIVDSGKVKAHKWTEALCSLAAPTEAPRQETEESKNEEEEITIVIGPNEEEPQVAEGPPEEEEEPQGEVGSPKEKEEPQGAVGSPEEKEEPKGAVGSLEKEEEPQSAARSPDDIPPLIHGDHVRKIVNAFKEANAFDKIALDAAHWKYVSAKEEYLTETEDQTFHENVKLIDETLLLQLLANEAKLFKLPLPKAARFVKVASHKIVEKVASVAKSTEQENAEEIMSETLSLVANDAPHCAGHGRRAGFTSNHTALLKRCFQKEIREKDITMRIVKIVR